MDVTLSFRLTEEDHKALKEAAGTYSSVSKVLALALSPYLEGRKVLPVKSKGRERQTTCTIDHTTKDALVRLAESSGLSTNDAIQFMVHDFIRSQK